LERIRLLIDPPASGAWNMAVDEVLLEAAAGEGRATLRFYEWDQPTLSLGYFQLAHDRQRHAASSRCPLVRRASGGGAIVHDRELTYSIALPHSPAHPIPPAALYEHFHRSLVTILADLGVAAAQFQPPPGHCAVESIANQECEPFLCFQRRCCGDIICGDAKIVGSAQRRRKGGVLQHGSILLARSAAAPELPGIRDLSAVDLAAADLIARWLPLLGAGLARSPAPEALTASERRRAEELVTARFAAREFTGRR
jgi:lipoate-protein ligase A